MPASSAASYCSCEMAPSVPTICGAKSPSGYSRVCSTCVSIPGKSTLRSLKSSTVSMEISFASTNGFVRLKYARSMP